MCGDRVDTAVLGVERAPMPSRVSRVRNMETPSWSGALMRVGKPIVRGAELLGGNRMPKKRMPVAERRQENETMRPAPPPVVSYNWPDTGPGARLREQADVRQVSL